MSCPFQRIVPSVGSSRVAIMRIKVVLPAPLGPTNPSMPGSQRSESSPQRPVLPIALAQVLNHQFHVMLSFCAAALYAPNGVAESLEAEGRQHHQQETQPGREAGVARTSLRCRATYSQP